MKTRRRIRFSETDASGRVHFSQILKWAEEAEHDALDAAGVTVFTNDGSDSGWPRAKVSCEYRAPLSFGDEVEVEINLLRIGRSSLSWGFLVRKLSSEAVVAAEGELIAVWVQGGEAAVIPDDVRSLLGLRLISDEREG